MENSNNSGKIIGALLIGAAIGGVLGILFAPDKGSETRKKIIGKTDDLAESLKERINSIVEQTKTELAMAEQNGKSIIK
jgi:gas vesicle protein